MSSDEKIRILLKIDQIKQAYPRITDNANLDMSLEEIYDIYENIKNKIASDRKQLIKDNIKQLGDILKKDIMAYKLNNILNKNDKWHILVLELSNFIDNNEIEDINNFIDFFVKVMKLVIYDMNINSTGKITLKNVVKAYENNQKKIDIERLMNIISLLPLLFYK